ncbi:transmembrane protein 220 isoform X2 [Ranitomeya imitator]|uniref:transmembrane protein 220 isoform X2 n=1 Tax=Ranitomeya imitator TaxID=111125 RepID=UPI0037E73B7B
MESADPLYQRALWRLCNVIMASFLTLAAYVQVIYVIPAALIFLLSINPDITGHIIWRTLSALHGAVCLIGASYLLLSGDIRNILHQEEGRELSGLVIIAVWMLLCKDSARATVGGVRLFVAVSVSVLPLLVWIYIYVDKEMRTSWPQHCKTAI